MNPKKVRGLIKLAAAETVTGSPEDNEANSAGRTLARMLLKGNAFPEPKEGQDEPDSIPDTDPAPEVDPDDPSPWKRRNARPSAKEVFVDKMSDFFFDQLRQKAASTPHAKPAQVIWHGLVNENGLYLTSDNTLTRNTDRAALFDTKHDATEHGKAVMRKHPNLKLFTRPVYR